MALTPEEFDKLKKQLVTKQSFVQPETNKLDTLKDVAIGFGKGAVQTAVGTARMTQGLGQRVIAGIDPTRNLNQVRKDTGFRSLQGQDAAKIDEQLASKNNAQKAGKVLEFATEILYPIGRAEEFAGIASKGKRALSSKFDGIGGRINSLETGLLEEGAQAKEKVIDLVMRLDDKTKTALDRTPRDVFDKFVEKGKLAVQDDRNRTPLESVGDDIISGLEQIKSRASSVGEQKSKYLSQAKIGLKRTGNIVRDAILDTQRVFNGMKLDAADKKVVKSFFDELKALPKNPTLKEVDQTIDLLQDSLYKSSRSDAVEVTDRITGQLRRILTDLNGKVGDIGGAQYKKFNKEYSDLIEVVTELNARVGKEGGGAGSFVKRLFSPSDARTKYLFEQLEKFTGQDYFRDARLAKFVMDALGDVRAESILNQIPTSARGTIEKVVDYGIKKVSNPLKSAERYINKTRPESFKKGEIPSTSAKISGKINMKNLVSQYFDEDPKSIIEHPEQALRITDLIKASQKVRSLGLPFNNVVITRKAIKHFVESRKQQGISKDKMMRLTGAIKSTLQNPSKIIDNSHKSPNSYLFAKDAETPHGIILEIVKIKERLEIKSIHFINRRTFIKLRDIGK